MTNYITKNMDKIKALRRGRRLAYLRKCLIVHKLIEKHENETTVRKQVFDKHIQPVIMCSYSSFNKMLNEPNPQKQINELLNIKN
jgi:hypothetical protein